MIAPFRTAAFYAVLAAAPALCQEIAFDFDPAHTEIEFTLPSTLHTVHGRFKLKHGAIRFDPATGKIAGAVVVDAASGQSGNASRDRRMSNSILESGRYPDIVFVPDRVEGTVAAQGSSQVLVHGSFTIHGAAHEIAVPVEVQRSNSRVTAKTHFSLPYIKWGMKNPSTLFLRVNDQVELNVSVATN